MPIWTVQSVNEQPNLTLCPWLIFEFQHDGKTLRAAIGYCIEITEARTTSPIEKFNIAALVAETQSGRIYKLSGPPGASRDALYVWQNLAVLRGIKAYKDVSNEVYSEYLKAIQ
ncbi:hypothetical protein [Comamonas testosteroni]|uniref:hypothetical protein n=1 Tax=Comamonas testosteroni TaxID=285 RepID=UPI00391BA9F2